MYEKANVISNQPNLIIPTRNCGFYTIRKQVEKWQMVKGRDRGFEQRRYLWKEDPLLCCCWNKGELGNNDKSAFSSFKSWWYQSARLKRKVRNVTSWDLHNLIPQTNGFGVTSLIWVISLSLSRQQPKVNLEVGTQRVPGLQVFFFLFYSHL